MLYRRIYDSNSSIPCNREKKIYVYICFVALFLIAVDCSNVSSQQEMRVRTGNRSSKSYFITSAAVRVGPLRSCFS